MAEAALNKSKKVVVENIIWPTAAVMAILIFSTGCSATGTDGSLSAGGDAAEICAPAPQEGFAAVGDVVTNNGEDELVIKGLELVNPTDLKHQESYVMLIDPVDDPSSGVVLGSTSTETTDPLQAAAWERRIKLQDFTLGPGEAANVIATLSLPTSVTEGETEAMRIAYSNGSRDFTADTSTSITMTDDACL